MTRSLHAAHFTKLDQIEDKAVELLSEQYGVRRVEQIVIVDYEGTITGVGSGLKQMCIAQA